jgi:SNF2 family DNA or RNA helicase
MLSRMTYQDISNAFTSTCLIHGSEYSLNNHVHNINIQNDGNVITSVVTGSAGKKYRVYIRLEAKNSSGVSISGECSCPVCINCKHAAATLFSAKKLLDFPLSPGETAQPTQKKSIEPPLPPEFTAWLNQIELADQPDMGQDELPDDVPQRLLYVIKPGTTKPPQLDIHFFTARRLKAGGYGKSSPHNSVLNSPNPAPRYFTQRDREIVAKLNTLRTGYYGQAKLSGENGANLLAELIATGRCFWNTPESMPLLPGEKRTTSPAWAIDDQGGQQMTFDISPPARVLPFSPPWYLDETRHTCGELDTGLPDKVAYALAGAPVIPAHLAARISSELAKKLTRHRTPLPVTLQERTIDNIIPTPCLRLYSVELPRPDYYDRYSRNMREAAPEWIDLAKLEYDYDGARAKTLSATDKSKVITQRHGNELRHIVRNFTLESKQEDELFYAGFSPVTAMDYRLSAQHADAYLLEGGEEDWIDFCHVDLPVMQAEGWKVEMDESFRFNFAEVEDWTATVNEGAGNDWFGLELGIQVDGQAVNLLPILVNMIRQFPKAFKTDTLTEMIAEDRDFVGSLPDGRLLVLPPARIKGILSVLVELFDLDESANPERLNLSLVQAARLAELADAATGLRWMGGERVLELGKKLRDFNGIQLATPPVGLKAELRSYQQEGLNWLQFLREYDLAGILADDMGLGKTVQALAHLLLEKESGRMNLPCLVVAPTSLMFNWQREAERFAPDLRVLVLQGLSRKQHFDSLGEYDLVLTTYPLLPHDEEVLTAQEFYYLVLDEAHIIKNPKAKATRIVHQIKTRHRLALTGTPLENHLGELWTQFNFLLPGLLGDDKSFRRLFRTPIEKQGNNERRGQLARRIAPFLLRRTKAQVAQDLPPKTEIVRYCQLGGAQRDLYEAIRVAMHEKVRMEIDKKGMNRSQIVILDALLKLRQACCDPRLLKLPTAKQIDQSAKLELLMSLLPEMLEAGRRILLFSQFTSMLALIELELAKTGIAYVKLTGDTTDRATPVQRFQNGEVSLFLISLKAGGVGLNLTAADTVIHYDPWWNPAAENQATDRAHRIGQENPVFVYKLITEGTVEEKIISMQGRKSELAQGVLDGSGEAATPLTADDLTRLFEPLE